MLNFVLVQVKDPGLIATSLRLEERKAFYIKEVIFMAKEIIAMERVRTSPDICSYVDSKQENLNIEISLPGVNKADIKLMMHDDSFNLSAPRGEDIEYVTTMSFCCPVKATKAKSAYKDGLLKIGIPFKDPMEDAVDVTIH
jgi:HSP20 family protein